MERSVETQAPCLPFQPRIAKLFLMKPTNLAAIKAAISSNRGRICYRSISPFRRVSVYMQFNTVGLFHWRQNQAARYLDLPQIICFAFLLTPVFSDTAGKGFIPNHAGLP
ncbi:hypothetical protein T09_11366 [Trichinella sp. T9]|nr:hypothetical protein T09_11366 [Trichinella sp. T9]